MPSPQGVPVATLLRDLAETRGIDLELVAGAGGVERRITYPHPQKTGLALTGFDKYLREGRVLVRLAHVDQARAALHSREGFTDVDAFDDCHRAQLSASRRTAGPRP